VWCGDLWKKFIYWWLLSPHDLGIFFRTEDCVKLKPQVASQPCHLVLSLYNSFSGSGRSQHAPQQNICLCRFDTGLLTGSELEDQEHV
jgi:hypothetical protein